MIALVGYLVNLHPQDAVATAYVVVQGVMSGLWCGGDLGLVRDYSSHMDVTWAFRLLVWIDLGLKESILMNRQ